MNHVIAMPFFDKPCGIDTHPLELHWESGGMGTLLVTGALGQIGSELVRKLQAQVGAANVIASDIRESAEFGDVTFVKLDVLDRDALATIVREHNVEVIYHLAAILSAAAERSPDLAWKVNMDGSLNVLNVAREAGVKKVFIPSSIAAFGPSTPLDDTPQDTIQRPNAIYGITKVAMELMGDYYFDKFQVDCRGVRFPGIISYRTPPGGGTTDYAIDMFVSALRGEPYTCYLSPDTSLDMMYMPDALKAMIEVMEADSEQLKHRNAFNVSAFALTPARLAAAIQEHVPSFECHYESESVRQAIADSWPNNMDDSAAREQWGWKPDYDLSAMVKDMLEKLPAFLDRFSSHS